MNIIQTAGWDDYQLLDSGNGKRLERFGTYILSRPDPQAIWHIGLSDDQWKKADAQFINDKWIVKTSVPEKWKLTYKNLSFWARLMPFKHTGVFPEQHVQWDFIIQTIKDGKHKIKTTPKVLNLFGYTGIASLAAASVGAQVTHVDASKPAITWTRENQELSSLQDKPIRWIIDDALVFVEREHRRGVTYDGIIMDPPAYGHGPNGEKWNFNESFPQLLAACKKVLSDNPLFIIINAYAISSSAVMLENMLLDTVGNTGTIEVGELALQESKRGRLLSTGIFARWSK